MTVYVTKVRGLNPQDGLVGGAIAGVIATLIAMVYGMFGAASFWTFPNLLVTLIGMQPGSGVGAAVVVGFIINVILLAVFGLVWALIARTLEGKQLLWGTLFYAALVWAVGYWLLLPDAGLGWSPRLQSGMGLLASLSAMLIYGSVLGAYLLRHQRRELVDQY